MNNIENKKIELSNRDNIIEIELKNKVDYKNKFNSERISTEMKDYILNEIKTINLKSKIKIIITCKEKLTLHDKEELNKLIKKTFKDDLYDIEIEYKIKIKNACIIMLIGIILLLGYYLINNTFFISEYILIIGWLLIWESAALFLFDSGKIKIKEIRVEQLINSEVPVGFIKPKNAINMTNVFPKNNVFKFMKKDDQTKFSTDYQLYELKAPICAGSEVGKMFVFDENNMVVEEVSLIISEDIKEIDFDYMFNRIVKIW